ncbi:MAG: radical SAM protein [Bacteroidetes bacterium]|nr:radical SAM protein [Bacteroidota bacterium]
MKILLIIPSTQTLFSCGTPELYKKLNIGFYPALGSLYLASYLREFSSHKVEILDIAVEGIGTEDLQKRIMNGSYQAVGIFATSFTINVVSKISKIVKEINPEINVIIGGPHVDIFPEETASLNGVDFVVLGEGEITLTELLNCIENKGNPEEIKGLVFKKEDKIIFSEKRPLIDNLNELPFPARDLTDYKKYHSLIGKSKVSTTLMTSRGCSFRCNFCFIQYGGKYRMRSAENVVKEIKQCVALGINEIFFFDELFTVKKSRVMDICNEIINNKLDIIFDIRSRVDTIDEEMLLKLKEAGCARIQYGVESGDPDILLAMNKRITIEQIRKAIKLTKKAGIDVFLDFMLGYPGETIEQMNRTIKFAIELNPDYLQFGITVLLPSTTIYQEALKNKFLKNDFWRELAKDPPETIIPPIASEKYSRDELEKILEKAYSKFYFRPRYLLKKLFKIRSFTQLARQLKAGFHLAFSK